MADAAWDLAALGGQPDGTPNPAPTSPPSGLADMQPAAAPQPKGVPESKADKGAWDLGALGGQPDAAPAPTAAAAMPAPKPVGTPAAESPKSNNGTTLVGVAGNYGAGINDFLTDTAGAIVDAPTKALNWMGHKAGMSQDIIGIPQGGTAGTLKSAFGMIGADPRTQTPNSYTERLARAAGNATGATLGMAGAGVLGEAAGLTGTAGEVSSELAGTAPMATTGQAAKTLGTAALSGAGAQAAEDAAPEPLKPYAALAGGMLAPAAGEMAWNRAMAASTGSKAEKAAANIIVKSSSDPDAVKAAVAAPRPDNLPDGYNPSAAELTGDQGLAHLHQTARNKDQTPFDEHAAANNAALQDSLSGIAKPTDPNTSPGAYFTGQLKKMDAADAQMVDAARAHADQVHGQLPGGEDPSVYGANANQMIDKRFADKQAQLNPLEATVTARANQASDAIGGTGTADEIGNTLRQFATGARQARDVQSNRLFAAVPDDVQFDPAPIQSAIQEATSRINPMGGGKLDPGEADLYGLPKMWQQKGFVPDASTLQQMRSKTSDMMNQAFMSGDRQLGARLKIVQNGIDDSLENAINRAHAQQQQQVQSGQLDPQSTIQAALEADVARWRNTGSSERPAGNVGGDSVGNGPTRNPAASTDAIPGMAGDDLPAAASGAGASRDTGVAPDQGQVDPAEHYNAAYTAARTDYRDKMATFAETGPKATLLGKMTRKGPYGDPEMLSDNRLPSMTWGDGTTAVDNLRNYVSGTGAATEPRIINAIGDAAAHSLRQEMAKASNPQLAYQRWMTKSESKFAEVPQLRDRFANYGSAMEQVKALTDARQALTDLHARATKGGDAQVMQTYARPGQAGVNAADAYKRVTGGSQQAVENWTNHMGNLLRQRAASKGNMNTAVYKSFMNDYGPAIDRMGVRDRFATSEKAQETLDKAIATQKANKEALEQGAARHWLNGTDPHTAVNNILSKRMNNDPVANMRDLMAHVKGDREATEGVKSAVRDWLVKAGSTNKEAGTTGTNYLKLQGMQDAVRENRPALAQVFGPQEMQTIDRMAAALKMNDRVISGTKAPNGPGSARDYFAMRPEAHHGNLLWALAKVTGGATGFVALEHFMGHMLGAAGGIAVLHGVEHIAKARAAAKLDHHTQMVQELVKTALLDPKVMNDLLTKTAPSHVPMMQQRLLAHLRTSAAFSQTLPNQ